MEPNQAEFRRDYLSELMEQQLLENRKLSNSFINMQLSQNDWNLHQKNQWKQVFKKLNDLQHSQGYQETLEHQAIDLLEKLEEQNTTLQQTVNYDQRFHTDLYEKVNQISQAHSATNGFLNQIQMQQNEASMTLSDLAVLNHVLSTNVEQLLTSHDRIETQLDEHLDLKQIIADTIDGLEETQKDVLDHVDQNEGILEKVLLQIDYLREILFERSNHLEEKIDQSLQSKNEYSEQK